MAFLPTTAIVDDRDPNINFTGRWVLDGAPPEFMGTTSRAVDKTAVASYDFVGMSA
jgi:hypothetical protein